MIGAQRDEYVVLTGDLKSKEVLNWKWLTGCGDRMDFISVFAMISLARFE